MGTALAPEGLFDLWLTDFGDAYLIETATEKGAALCKRYLKTRAATRAAVPRRDELRAEALGRYRLRLDVPAADIPRVLDAGWDSPMWEELGRKCFSCASCTMTCPTCVCFRVVDRNTIDGTSGVRLRRWDSCMFDGFAEVASGENFRPNGHGKTASQAAPQGEIYAGALGRHGLRRLRPLHPRLSGRYRKPRLRVEPPGERGGREGDLKQAAKRGLFSRGSP